MYCPCVESENIVCATIYTDSLKEYEMNVFVYLYIDCVHHLPRHFECHVMYL